MGRQAIKPAGADTRALVARVEKSRERVDWDVYIDLMDQIRAIAGSAEVMAEMFESHPDALPELSHLAGLFVGPTQLTRFVVDTFATAAFSHMTNTVEKLGRDSLRVTTSLPSVYRSGTSFFECSVGGLRSLPRYMDLPPAQIEAEIGNQRHEGTYRVKLPLSRTLAARVAPAMRAALEQLRLYAEELQQLTGAAAQPQWRHIARRCGGTVRVHAAAARRRRAVGSGRQQQRNRRRSLSRAERTVEAARQHARCGRPIPPIRTHSSRRPVQARGE